MAQKKRTTTQRKPAEQPRTEAAPATTEATTTEAPAAEAPTPRKSPLYCVVDGCDRPRIQNLEPDPGLCGAHYASRRGDHI